MSNFTKSIVYSAAVLAVGLIAIFAIYNNMAGQPGMSGIEPAAGEEVVTETTTDVVTEDGAVVEETVTETVAPVEGEVAPAVEGTIAPTSAGELAPAETPAETIEEVPSTDETAPAGETPAEAPAAEETAH